MEEYSRMLIEEYCMEHDSKKSRRLEKLVKMSYDMFAEGKESDALFLEKCIGEEENLELKAALEDLDGFLFG